MIAVVCLVLPSFRSNFNVRDRAVLIGLLILGAGAAPFLYAGYPFATDGIFDRANGAADLGTALVYGCALDAMCALLLLRWASARNAAAVVVAVPIAYIMSMNATDLRDYRAAVRDGHQLLANLATDLRSVPPGGVLVTPPMPNRGGVAMFILSGDLQNALEEHRQEAVPPIRIEEAFEVVVPTEKYEYDRETRKLTER
jgi:hypothetical protein